MSLGSREAKSEPAISASSQPDLLSNTPPLDFRDLVDEAKDYHLMPERRPHLPAFKTRPRCCTSIAGLIYAVGGLNSAGTLQWKDHQGLGEMMACWNSLLWKRGAVSPPPCSTLTLPVTPSGWLCP